MEDNVEDGLMEDGPTADSVTEASGMETAAGKGRGVDETISDLLDEAARRAVPVVAGIPDEALTAPTPCAEYRVRDLLDHLFHVVVGFQELAEKREADFSSTPEYVRGDWRDRFPRETRALVRAWSRPEAEEGTAGAMGLPARTLGAMVLLDLTVHPWDLARATGGDFEPCESALTELEALAEQMGPTARSVGAFAEPVPVAPDAGRFARLLGALGRDPQWVPPAR
jgi:uncharacterized protein (TIGR03086 family)